MSNKIKHGQFFTKRNVFNLISFKEWWDLIPVEDKKNILEPFAGANNIINLLKELDFIEEYNSYDIEPKDPSVTERDTLNDFPKGFKCIVTNPPYLSKNSAAKKKINIDFNNFQDLYEISLNKCLENSDYIAAIIPESFITTNKLKERLYSVISLTYDDIFSDTEHPVCLALFVKEKTEDYYIYKNDLLLGTYNKLNKIKSDILKEYSEKSLKVRFNIPNGNIHLLAVDNNYNSSGMFFSTENLVKEEEIKISSRARTRIEISINDIVVVDKELLNKIVERSNKILSEYRENTYDTFMTSFKGLRKDTFYRRRLDFKTAKLILINSIIKLGVLKNEL